jgi:hypothetical protein
MPGNWNKHEPMAAIVLRRLQMLTLRLGRVEALKQMQRAHAVLKMLARRPDGK